MARPRSLPDETVLDRLLQTLSDCGPENLTFQRAAQGVGLSAATLVQRFGSRDAMVERTLLFAWDGLDEATRLADQAHDLTPDGAITLLLDLMPPDTDEDSTIDGLLLLREDMRNPALRSRGAAWGTTLATVLGRRLTQDPLQQGRLGRQMACLWQGTTLWWGFDRSGSARDAARRALEDWCRTAGLMR